MKLRSRAEIERDFECHTSGPEALGLLLEVLLDVRALLRLGQGELRPDQW
jgi:hypothetical protein